MKYYQRFTSLAKQLISLTDAGNKLNIHDTHKHIRDLTIFEWINDKYPGSLDMTEHGKGDLTVMSEYFKKLSTIVDERRKFEIENDGICLLIAYCIEATEANPNTIQDNNY